MKPDLGGGVKDQQRKWGPRRTGRINRGNGARDVMEGSAIGPGVFKCSVQFAVFIIIIFI